MMSGGIDSPVTGYLMLSRGYEIVALHMDNQPFTDESTIWKVKEHVKKLENLFNTNIKLYITPHGDNQLEFIRNCDRHVGCLLCRRLMWRIAEKVAIKEGCDFITTGESIGQVASQTVKNIRVESGVLNTPIIRPLAGMDKMEIIEIARKIGTYDISISPGICCKAVPDKPATSAKLEKVLNEEGKVSVELMVETSLRTTRVE